MECRLLSPGHDRHLGCLRLSAWLESPGEPDRVTGRVRRCLRRGDLKDAVLQLKMAIAREPQSAFLRTALAEVETEVGK